MSLQIEELKDSIQALKNEMLLHAEDHQARLEQVILRNWEVLKDNPGVMSLAQEIAREYSRHGFERGVYEVTVYIASKLGVKTAVEGGANMDIAKLIANRGHHCAPEDAMNTYPVIQNDGRVLDWIRVPDSVATVQWTDLPQVQTFEKVGRGGRLAFLEVGHDPEQMMTCVRIAYGVMDHNSAGKSWYLEAGAVWTIHHPTAHQLYDNLRWSPGGNYALPSVQYIGTPTAYEVMAASSAHGRSRR